MKRKMEPVNQYRIVERYDHRSTEPTYCTVQKLYIDRKGNSEWKTMGQNHYGRSYAMISGVFVEHRFGSIELAKIDIEKRIIQNGFVPKVIMEIKGEK